MYSDQSWLNQTPQIESEVMTDRSCHRHWLFQLSVHRFLVLHSVDPRRPVFSCVYDFPIIFVSICVLSHVPTDVKVTMSAVGPLSDNHFRLILEEGSHILEGVLTIIKRFLEILGGLFINIALLSVTFCINSIIFIFQITPAGRAFYTWHNLQEHIPFFKEICS